MHRVPGGRPAAWLTSVLVGVVGACVFGVGIVEAEDRYLSLSIGAFLLSVAGTMVMGSARRAAPGWSVATLDGRPAWELRLGGSGSTVAVAVVPGLLALVLVLAAPRAETPAAVLACALALGLAVVAVEGVRILVRRPRLRIGVDRLELRGTGIDATLAWDDVTRIGYDHFGTRWLGVVVEAAADAPSYRFELSRLILPTDRVPEPPGLHVRVGLVPDSARLVSLLIGMQTRGRATREALLDRGLPEASGL